MIQIGRIKDKIEGLLQFERFFDISVARMSSNSFFCLTGQLRSHDDEKHLNRNFGAAGSGKIWSKSSESNGNFGLAS